LRRWPALPLQAELSDINIGGEVFLSGVAEVLSRPDSNELADLLEVYGLCLLLGFKGRYAAGGSGDLRGVQIAVQEKNSPHSRCIGRIVTARMIPADAVRLAQTDPWVRRLFIGTIAATVVTS